MSAGRQRSGRPQRHLGRARGRLPRSRPPGLIEGGADILLIETIFDTLNAKAAIAAVQSLFEELGERAAADHLGDDRRRVRPDAVGPDRRGVLAQHPPRRPAASSGSTARSGRSSSASTSTSCRASPTGPSRPTRTPACRTSWAATTRRPRQMAEALGEWARHGLLNVAGGCCGSTPDHVAAIAAAVAGLPPRQIPEPTGATRLSGLEPLVDPAAGQRLRQRRRADQRHRLAQVRPAGRRRRGEDEAVDIAREQVANGAQLVDVNMDEAMLDGVAAMTRFLRRIAAEPDIATVPVMVDSSKWSVIEAGLQQLQGKGVVNSISLKEGEDEFLRQARLCRRYGAAVVVMAFDEQGQADSVERRVAVLRRAYDLLTERVGFAPEDIILDANIFAIATGMEEHNAYAVSFIEAVRRLKARVPGDADVAAACRTCRSRSAATTGSARRSTRSSCITRSRAGLDMAIVNAGVLPIYDDIEPELRERVEDVVLNRRARRDRAAARAAPRGTPARAAMERAGRGPRLARAARRRAPDPRPGRGHRRLHRRGHRGGAARGGPPARRHRGPADGRDERRRRPVRVGADVPAPGRQERPGHEEGRRRTSSRTSRRSARARAGEPARS